MFKSKYRQIKLFIQESKRPRIFCWDYCIGWSHVFWPKRVFLSREKTSGVEESAEEKASSPPRRNVLTYNEYLAKHYSERNTPGDIRYEFGIVRVSRAVVVDPKPFASDPGSEHDYTTQKFALLHGTGFVSGCWANSIFFNNRRKTCIL